MTLTEGLLATFLSLFPAPPPEATPQFAPIPAWTGLELPLELSFLDRTTGKLMRAVKAADANTFSLLPHERAESLPRGIVALKNLDENPTFYFPTSFCLPLLQSAPVLYIVDAARVAERDYYLTVHGKVIEGSGNQLVVEPGLKSIAYAGDRWLLLLADGSVVQSRALEARHEYQKIEGLRLPPGAKLTAGLGPRQVAVNGVCTNSL